jgi:hypothetical protein
MPRSLTGLTPRQEQAFNERAQAIAARRIEGKLFREIRKTMNAMGAAYNNGLTRETVMAAHREQIERILIQEYNRAFDVFGQRMIDAAGKAHPGKFEKKEADSLFVRLARAWVMQRVAEKVTPIINTTRKQAERLIRQVTDTAVVEGLGVEALGRLMRQTFRQEASALSRARANTIARTETHNAANSAAHEAIRSTGLPVSKEWVAAIDGRERESHAAANGQIVDMNQPFLVDGEELQYPGDPSGSAENVINCRCAVAHVVND